MDYRSKTFILSVLLVALVIVLLIGTAIALAFARSGNLGATSHERTGGAVGGAHDQPAASDCWPRRSLPKRDLSKLKNLAAADNKSMATMAAYIQLFDNNHAGFIPLQLERVALSTGPPANVLTLASDCAELKIGYMMAASKLRFAGMKWFLRDELHAADLPTVCEFAPTQFKHAISPETRFSCLGRLAYHCNADSYDGAGNRYRKPVGQIVFDALEVELAGTSALIEQGEYSKEPADGGCSL